MIALFLVFSLIVLQLLPFNPMSIRGIKPDFFLLITVFVGLYYGEKDGMLWGLGLGLLEDALSSTLFGLNALTKVISGFASGLSRKRIVHENPMLHFLVTFFFAVFDFSCVVFVTNLNMYPFNHIVLFSRVIFLSSLYNGIIAIPFFFILEKLEFPRGKHVC